MFELPIVLMFVLALTAATCFWFGGYFIGREAGRRYELDRRYARRLATRV